MHFDPHPSFGNVDSVIPIDVAGMKSYMDGLFDPTCVPVGVTINKLNLAPNRNIGIVESTFPKLGYPRSNNTTADL